MVSSCGVNLIDNIPTGQKLLVKIVFAADAGRDPFPARRTVPIGDVAVQLCLHQGLCAVYMWC